MKTRRLICRIRGHRWDPLAMNYFELYCPYCHHTPSAGEPEPAYLLRHSHRLRYRLWQFGFFFRYSRLGQFLRRLRSRYRREAPEEDIPF